MKKLRHRVPQVRGTERQSPHSAPDSLAPSPTLCHFLMSPLPIRQVSRDGHNRGSPRRRLSTLLEQYGEQLGLQGAQLSVSTSGKCGELLEDLAQLRTFLGSSPEANVLA